ncbi:nucleotide-binding universal stress UspA family protein [Mycoplana sp. BE70]|uniref:universal stress protein n=1 Tax=Mycoplana sp. BE70 TaxID=2817775 RepID=UPI00285B4922|nr:universal stress protein [Mycoplana sp. BE70]MDR6755992.1 nucleotide-binding universal stress UspA family protein [Mycoplana sp. BE70]
MYKKIIVPVAMDQLERGEQILRRAADLLADDGEIVLVHVIEAATGYLSIEFPAAMVEMEIKQAEERLGRMRQDLGISALIDIRYGGSARQIIAAAEEHEADLILIASHRPGLTNYLLGATADRVVRHSPMSVLVDR